MMKKVPVDRMHLSNRYFFMEALGYVKTPLIWNALHKPPKEESAQRNGRYRLDSLDEEANRSKPVVISNVDSGRMKKEKRLRGSAIFITIENNMTYIPMMTKVCVVCINVSVMCSFAEVICREILEDCFVIKRNLTMVKIRTGI